MGGKEDAAADTKACNPVSGPRKTYSRSVSWSAPRSSAPEEHGRERAGDTSGENTSHGQSRRFPVPLTPRSHQNSKGRSCLPPLHIARRSVDEWPMAGSDDIGEWPQPSTPSGRPGASKPGEGPKLDLSSLGPQGARDRITGFDKECSKVADHIYIGGDIVARDREILRCNGITHVLNCVGHFCPEYFRSDLVYKTLWLQDSISEDITSILYDVFDYFEDVREQGGRVFVHCCQGVSRSTSLVIAYLMWRKGQSFDDAFQLVKAARGIANPNMGFACQLVQCQKRVHAIPLSPNSVVRMYRMAPHSEYDPLHLVPKMLSEPSLLSLDSRGAFIVHVFSSIFVWIGKNCEPVMEKDAKTAAYQVVRYEKVQGPIVTVEEGEEPLEFWESFSNATVTSDNNIKVSNEHMELATEIDAGKRNVQQYDADFKLVYQAISGGVVPPFSSSGSGHETHVPARESNWSVLRRKFISGAVKEWVSASRAATCKVYSDSSLLKETDAQSIKTQHLSTDSSTSPLYLSPSSLCSDTSSSSKCSSESPSFSPSTASPSASPALSDLTDTLLPPSKSSNPHSNNPDSANVCLKEVSSPSKVFPCSLAERRGRFSPLLKLSTSNKESSQSITRGSSPKSTSRISPQFIAKDSDNHNSGSGPYVIPSNVGKVSANKHASDVSENYLYLSESCKPQELLPCSTGSAINDSTHSDSVRPIVFRWPGFTEIPEFGRGDLNSEAVLLFLAPNGSSDAPSDQVLHLWIGNRFEHDNGNTDVDSTRGVEETKDIDWNLVGSEFLESMRLPKHIPIKVVEGNEPEFLELLNLF
uniref:Dual specificity protein phosphatase 1B n=1 Tax=Anthurium amnicola TaxID=1678845 RepID=A0A1D1Y621_9ARAE